MSRPSKRTLAGGRAVERAEKLEERRLARAARPDDRDATRRRDREVDVAHGVHVSPAEA